MDILKVKKVRENAILPKRGSAQAAGLDLCACIDEPLTVASGERCSVPTGIAIALPKNTAGLVYARSGLATKHGLGLANSVGVIDSDYRGELLICLYNTGTEPYTVEPSERVAQLIVTPVLFTPVVETEELDKTERGTAGFGSTGKTAL